MRLSKNKNFPIEQKYLTAKGISEVSSMWVDKNRELKNKASKTIKNLLKLKYVQQIKNKNIYKS